MKPTLNEEQIRAVTEFETDLLVTAGAGTGKTSVLTNKYLRLLEERRAGVAGIVAITFTKKAAAEMRARIQHGIRERLTESQESEDCEFWQNQLLKMESARISTFHSFCLGLLREYPLEVMIPPVTSILNEGEENIYLNQTIEDALLVAFQDSTVDQSLLTQLIMDFGWDSFIRNIRIIYQKVRESGRNFSELTAESNSALERAIQQTPVELRHLVEAVDELLQFCGTISLTANATELVAAFREKWPGQKDDLQGNPSANSYLNILLEIRKGLPKTVPQTIKERVVEIHQLLEAMMRKISDRESQIRLNILNSILERIDRSYQALKQKLALLDFSDQQLFARNLLKNHPDIAERVRQGIQYLLVDEFQDTNRLQMEIVDLLTGSNYTQGRLMAVGDVKQSIYRFRGAEAEIITGLAERFSAKQAKVIPLTRNYRSADRIICFANRLFQRLFQDEAFNFEPLEPTVVTPNANVEFLLTGDQDRHHEAELLAQRIQQLIMESDSNLNYGDMVILFRASTAMPIYQQALQRLGIPYYTASGGDFYHRPEIMDQLNLLRLVEQSYHGIALLGLLNSPYVELGNESLIALSQGRELVKLFYESETFPGSIPEAERNRLVQFRNLIGYLQENRENLAIPSIIRYALENSYYREILWSLPNAGQRLANLDKLLEKADEFTAKGFHDLRHFLEFIEQLTEVEVLEGEAPTQGETENAVRLMTIHRAKGLEFPVVMIPDLDRKFLGANPGKLAFHRSLGFGMSIPFNEGESSPSSLWERIKEVDKQEEFSELKRVLYVAITRAKQQLIMIGSGGNPSKANTITTANNWMKWFELILPLAKAGPILDFEGVPIKITREVPAVKPPVATGSFIEANWQILNQGFDPALDTQQEVASTRAPDRPNQRTYQVSELIAFQECPRRYYWEYRLGLTGALFHHSNPERKLNADFGTRIGGFIHQAFQPSESTWPENLWREHFSDVPAANLTKLRQDVTQMWQNFRQSPFSEIQGKCWDEVPFILKFSEDIKIEGRFDRLIQPENGQFILVDYKTHRISGEEAVIQAEKYFRQLQLYALAVRELWGELPHQATIYFPFSNQAVPVPIDKHSLELTKEQIISGIQFLAEHKQIPDYAPCELCKHCDYNHFCLI